MRTSPLLVAALLAAAPASALVVRTYAPQIAGGRYRSPVIQNRAQGFRPLQPMGFSLGAPAMTLSPLALGRSLVQQAPEVRAQAYAFAPTAALSRSVGELSSLLNTGAPSERLSIQAQTLFDGKRLSAGSEGSFATGQGSLYAKEVQEAVDAAVELRRLVDGTQATDAVLANVRAYASEKILKTAAMIEAVEDGAKLDPLIMDPMLETFEMMSADLFMEMYASDLDRSIRAGAVPKADRAHILEKIKAPIATIVRVHKAWGRVLIAAKDKNPKFGANLLSKLEDMRGGAKVAVTLTFDEKDSSSVAAITALVARHGATVKFMGQEMGVAVLGEFGIMALRELADIPQVTHVDLEKNYSIH